MNKRPYYPGDGICVVLCMSPIVAASCESGSESSSWLPHKLWQDVPPTRRACVCVCQCESWPSGMFSSVSVCECLCVCVCIASLAVSSHIHVSLPLCPAATLCISLWLLRLHPSSVHPNLRPRHILSVCVCACVRVCVPSYSCKGHLNVSAILTWGNPICRLTPV